MKPWNLLADHTRSIRRVRVGAALLLSALGGAGWAAWCQSAQQTARAQQQVALAAAQSRLNEVKNQVSQAQATQSQNAKAQERFRYVQALHRRADNLDVLMRTLATQWPPGIQIQEWRLEGPQWRLQGQASAAEDVARMLRNLETGLIWQQPPSLLEFATSSSALSPSQGVRYIAQARLNWPEFPQVSR